MAPSALSSERLGTYTAVVGAVVAANGMGYRASDIAAATHLFDGWYSRLPSDLRTHVDSVLDTVEQEPIQGFSGLRPEERVRNLRAWSYAGPGPALGMQSGTRSERLRFAARSAVALASPPFDHSNNPGRNPPLSV
jgi:hypothetical protein